MREVIKYNKNRELEEVLEINDKDRLESLFRFKGKEFFKFWNYESSKRVEHISFKQKGKLISHKFMGSRWTRVVLSDKKDVTFPDIKKRISLNNGKLESFKVTNNLLEKWKTKI